MTVVGGARVAIHGSAKGTLARTALKDCFQAGTPRGNCDAARIPVTDYRVEIAGPEPRAVHVIDATGPRGEAKRQPISGDGWTGVQLEGVRDAVVVWPDHPGAALTYRAPRRRAISHVVLDAPAANGKARVTARPDGDACQVTVEPGGIQPATPVIVALDDRCAVVAEPEADRTAPRIRPQARAGSHATPGCCGTGSGPATPMAMALAVLVPLRRRRR